MNVKAMNILDSDSPNNMGLRDFLNQCENIIIEPGINWCHLRLVTEEQLETLKSIFKREQIRYNIYEKTVGMVDHFSNIVKAREWFNSPKKYPGQKEKAWLIEKLQLYKVNGEFTGIAPEAYDELLEKLYAIPDKPDIEGYSLRYHY